MKPLNEVWNDFFACVSGKTKSDLMACHNATDILSAENSNYLLKIKTLNDVVYQAGKEKADLAEKVVELQNSLSEEEAEVVNLEVAIESLKTELAINGDIVPPFPPFLDQTLKFYKPYRQIVNPEGTVGGYNLTDPREVYQPSRSMRDLVVSQNWRKKSKFDKLMAAWTWNCTYSTRHYIADFGDNWQLPFETLRRSGGDCEDSTTLLVSMWRLLGISPTECGNVIGPTSFGYHSYPIAYLSDVDIAGTNVTKTGWHIFESTLNGVPTIPLRLEGSGTYFVDNGFQNWAFYGGIGADSQKQFNFAAGAVPGTQRIENSDLKGSEIQKFWESNDLVKKSKKR